MRERERRGDDGSSKRGTRESFERKIGQLSSVIRRCVVQFSTSQPPTFGYYYSSTLESKRVGAQIRRLITNESERGERAGESRTGQSHLLLFLGGIERGERRARINSSIRGINLQKLGEKLVENVGRTARDFEAVRENFVCTNPEWVNPRGGSSRQMFIEMSIETIRRRPRAL